VHPVARQSPPLQQERLLGHPLSLVVFSFSVVHVLVEELHKVVSPQVPLCPSVAISQQPFIPEHSSPKPALEQVVVGS
jgi:hypothetical protein